MFIEQCNDSRVLATSVLNVNLTAHVRREAKGFTNIAGEKRVRQQTIVIRSIDDGVERDDLGGQKARGGLVFVGGGCLTSTNNFLNGGGAPQQLCGGGGRGPRHTGKKIFRTA